MAMLCSNNESFFTQLVYQPYENSYPGNDLVQMTSEQGRSIQSYTWTEMEDSWCSNNSDSGCSMESGDDSGNFIQGSDVVFSSGVVQPTTTATSSGRRNSEIATSQILTELNQAQIHESIMMRPSNSYFPSHMQEEDDGYNEIIISDDEDDLLSIEESYFKNEDFCIIEPAEQVLPGIVSFLGESNNSQQQSVVPEVTQEAWPQQSQDPIIKEETRDEAFANHRGRRETRKLPILSLFLLDALEKPNEYEHMIRWVDREKGVFEFSSKHKEKFAKTWGVAKNNRCEMTYQKMSRALRIYVKKGKVLRKMRRKLQYVFRPEFLQDALSKPGPALA